MAKMSAKEVLAMCWDGESLPVSVTSIAAKLGVYVLGDPTLTVSGHYTPQDERLGVPLITFKPDEPLVRRRFTVAHELGHHCLEHGEYDRHAPPDFMSDSKDWKEVQANGFAAELLMPEDAVRALVEVRKLTDINRLAQIFQVSRFAMAYRLENLGYAVR